MHNCDVTVTIPGPQGPAGAIRPHAPARLVATTPIALSGLPTIDGVAVEAGDRILVVAQTTLAKNGVYVASSIAWERASDFAKWSDFVSAQVQVTSGDDYGSSVWSCLASGAGAMETGNLEWLLTFDPAYGRGRISEQVNAAEAAKTYVQETIAAGAIAYATLAELNANLTPADRALAQVLDDGANNGLYQKAGAPGSGVWNKKSSATIVSVSAWNDYKRFSEAWPKIALPHAYNGQILSGAQWWTGSAVSASLQRGIQIPAGATGKNSYVRWLWNLTDEDRRKYASRPIKLVVLLKTSAGAFDDVANWSLSHDASSGTFGDISISRINPTSYLFTADYLVAGSEASVGIFIQRTSLNVAAVDINFWSIAQYLVPMDADGFKDVFAAHNAPNIVREINDIALASSFGQAFAGAAISSSGVLSVPAGQTGVNSYVAWRIPIHQERLHAGEKITLTAVINLSSGFRATVTQIGHGVSGLIDGASLSNLQVSGTVAVSDLGDVRTVTADYVVRGAAQEYVGVYIQILAGSGAAAVSATPISCSYRLASNGSNEDTIRRQVDQGRVDSGDMYQYVALSGQLFAGATPRDSGYGFAVPAGQTGVNSYVAYKFPVDSLAKFPGAKICVALLMSMSVDFDAQTPLTYGMTVYTGSGSRNAPTAGATFRKINSTAYLLEFFYTIAGNELFLRPYVQVSASASPRTSDGYLTYLGLRVIPNSIGASLPSPGGLPYSLADIGLTFRNALLSATIAASLQSGSEYAETIIVRQDGAGDFTSLSAAIAARGGGSSTSQRKLYKLYEGVYSEANVTIPNFVDIVGVGQRDRIWIRGYLPPDSPLATITSTSTVDFRNTGRLKNLKITCQNMRYAIHSDSAASANRAQQEIIGCYVEHVGNQEARDYQTSISGDPAGVWASEHAFGCGTHSGESIIIKYSKFVAPFTGFYFHTNLDFSEPSAIELHHCEVICTTEANFGIIVQALGSGQPTRLIIDHTSIEGALYLSPSPPLAMDRYNYYGNANAEVEIRAGGSSAIPWKTSTYFNVLELRSIDAVGSSVSVSGTAAPLLFGAVPQYEYGGSGYAARVRSSFAIGFHSPLASVPVDISLAARLGNLSGASKTLTVAFDGGAPIDIVLNQDFTGMTNAAIIGVLNTLLADVSGRAFSEIDPYAGVANVYQPERELTLQNNSGVVILSGQGVAFDGSRRLGRKATSSDAREVIAGVALENIAPGRFGRVLKSGRLTNQQIRISGSPSYNWATTFGLSSTAGDFASGATTPFMRVISPTGALTKIFEII